jgi:hypothetical protein
MFAELALAFSLSISDLKGLDHDDYKVRVETVRKINKTITKDNVDEKLEALVKAYKKSRSLEQRLLLEAIMKYAYHVKWWKSIRDDNYEEEWAIREFNEAFARWKKLEGLKRMEGLN